MAESKHAPILLSLGLSIYKPAGRPRKIESTMLFGIEYDEDRTWAWALDELQQFWFSDEKAIVNESRVLKELKKFGFVHFSKAFESFYDFVPTGEPN